MNSKEKTLEYAKNLENYGEPTGFTDFTGDPLFIGDIGYSLSSNRSGGIYITVTMITGATEYNLRTLGRIKDPSLFVKKEPVCLSGWDSLFEYFNRTGAIA